MAVSGVSLSPEKRFSTLACVWPWRAKYSVTPSGSSSAIRLLRHGDVGRVLGFHAHHMVAGIDMQILAGDGAPHVRQQIKCGIAHFALRDGAAQGRVVLVPFE